MDGSLKVWKGEQVPDDWPVRRFALRVVSELARASVARAGVSQTERAGAPQTETTSVLKRYARTGDASLLSELHAEMTRNQVSAEDVMDIHLPHVVQIIGTAWHDDQIDILQASLAFARLQTVLRELGKAWVSDSVGRATDGRMLLVLPEGEQHTLGAMFAANQLRRRGVSVKVMLSASRAAMHQSIACNRYHGILVSVSNESALQTCGQLVSDLRATASSHTPIVLGGGLVSATISDNGLSRISEATGADVVTNDISCALHACGIQRINAAAE